ILDYEDRTTCVLFGDAAGAVLLEPATDGSGLLDFAHEVDGTGACYLYMPGGGSLNPPTHETVDRKLHYIRQEGPHVFKYAVRKFAESSVALLERNGFSGADLDLFVPHQANVRIINAAQERLGLPDAKVVKNIDVYGNTTAATIPLAMGTALDQGRLRPGHLVLLAAVGAGFTVGTALVRWTGFDWKYPGLLWAGYGSRGLIGESKLKPVEGSSETALPASSPYRPSCTIAPPPPAPRAPARVVSA